MINTERIVPVQAQNLIDLYATMLKIGSVSATKVTASSIGTFSVSADGTYLCNEPVKSFDFATGASDAVAYFIPDYDYEGFKVAGVAVTTTGATVAKDGCSLYTATLDNGAVAIAKIGL